MHDAEHDAERIAEAYRQAEASFRLEGLDSTGNVQYETLRARVIAGEIDSDEAIRLTVEHYKALGRASAANYAVAE
jgi:hypothetical protein